MQRVSPFNWQSSRYLVDIEMFSFFHDFQENNFIQIILKHLMIVKLEFVSFDFVIR